MEPATASLRIPIRDARREMTSNGSGRARFGPFEVDLYTRELWKFGTRLKLVGQPFEILAVLLSKPGELVTREELHSRLWPADTFVDFNHGLNAAVNKLRDALSDSAEAPRYVETLPRRGYRFIGTIEWIEARPSGTPQAEAVEKAVVIPAPVAAPAVEAPAVNVIPPAAPPPANPEAASAGSRSSAWPRFVIGAAVLLVVLGGAFIAFRRMSGDGVAAHLQAERSRLLTSVSGTASPAFSPDGNFVAFTRDSRGGVFVSAIGNDQPMQLTNQEGDCCPAWSPDGRFIAFSRYTGKQFSIYIVPADGGMERKEDAEKDLKARPAVFASSGNNLIERKLETGGVIPTHGELDWSADGKSIAFSGPGGIYLVSLADSSARRVTEAPESAEDWGPAFSPDGQKLLFVRNQEIGLPAEIWVTSAAGGNASRVLSERGKIVSTPQWSFDGKSVIFASNRSGHPALWRAALDAPDSAVQIGEAGSPAWDPAVSRRGYRLAYERISRSLSIWEMDVSSPEKRPHILVSSTSDTDQGPGPQFSPDGKKLAFMSDRSGTMEIWVSNRDGSNPFQLSAVGGAGTPRWSPDSHSIVFDVNTTSGAKIVSMDVRGGAPQILTQDSFHSVCPSWSHDGKWIYFASPRSGEWEVWKIPAGGGSPMQITHHGGHAPLESADGKYIYYAKSPTPEPGVWVVPAEGGTESPLPLVQPGTWASWQVTESGIVFVGPSLGHQAVLSSYDFSKRRTTILAVLDRVPFWLGATRDGQAVAFDRPGQEEAQAMLVENFR